MAKKIVKKTKIKLWNLLIVLFVFAGGFFGVKAILQEPIHNIVVIGNHYLSDDDIIDLAGVRDYPSLYLLNRKKTCQKVLKSSYVEECKIHKKWGFVFSIVIQEKKALFYDSNEKKYVFSDQKMVVEDEISKHFRVPRLLNYVPDKKYQKFIQGMSKVKEDTLSQIGDIEYQPNEYDKDRFLLYMDDGNMVYLTLTKFKMINHYNEVLEQLEGHKGILYLDSGNHFKIME